MAQPQNLNIQWRYSSAIFDPNYWHEISESRVDWLFRLPFGSNLHSLDDAGATLEIKGLRPQRWQLLPLDGVPGRYALRSNYTGPGMQISACYKPDEADSARTGICLRPSSGEDSQKWDVDFVETTGSTYVFRNVDNATNFVLDCHPGNPIFMSADFNPANSPAQHWIVRPDRTIDDENYSVTYTNLPAGVTNKPLPATTRDPGATETPRGDGSARPPLSAGAAAGIGVGAALAVLLLGALAFAFLWQRRRGGWGGREAPGATAPGAVAQTTWSPVGKSPPDSHPEHPSGYPAAAASGSASGFQMYQQQQQNQPQSQQLGAGHDPYGGRDGGTGTGAGHEWWRRGPGPVEAMNTPMRTPELDSRQMG